VGKEVRHRLVNLLGWLEQALTCVLVDRITATYPSLDAIVLNAGFQRTIDFTNPSSLNLPELDAEVTTNYLSPLHAIAHFLPHLISLGAPSSDGKTNPRPATIVLITSGLAVVPLPRCANYCAAKAALHSLAYTLRSQLSAPNAKHTHHIRVIDVLPPAVKTELHVKQPELVKIGEGDIGMELDAWADEIWGYLKDGSVMQSVDDDNWVDEFVVKQQREQGFGGIETKRREVFRKMESRMRGQEKS
jgi:short-subunit dehydrogenase involved in D-alanine esterification of teichoic acids